MVIYQTIGDERELSPLACNVYSNCGHGCKYCQVPQQKCTSMDEFIHPCLRDNFLEQLEQDAARLQAQGCKDQVFLSPLCDPYQHFDIIHELTRQTIQCLHRHGLAVSILTKGGSRAERDLELFTPHDTFAITLTTLDEAEALKWEPQAALPLDRLATLRNFKEHGIPVHIYLTPVIDRISTELIIAQTHHYVDLYHVGKLNETEDYASTVNWGEYGRHLLELLDKFECKYYIKEELRKYLNTSYTADNLSFVAYPQNGVSTLERFFGTAG